MTDEEIEAAILQMYANVGIDPEEADYLIDWGVKVVWAMADKDLKGRDTVTYTDTSLHTIMALALSSFLAQRDHTLERDATALLQCSAFLAQCVVDTLEKYGLHVEDQYHFTLRRVGK